MEFAQVFVPLLFFLVIAGVMGQKSTFNVQEYERLVIFRLGKPVGIHGPGRVMVIPFLQSGVKYDVSDPFNAKLIDSYLAQGVPLRQG